MSRMYRASHRQLQDRFDTRRMADKLEELIVHSEITESDRAFIETRDMFWLATVDPDGRPTVSYKGGDPGFVRVVDATTVAFPAYDGNGMYYSMGNIVANGRIGMLFMDLEKPHRLRLQGLATIREDDPLLGEFAEAQLVVRVAVTEIFQNCPRYVHRFQKVQASKYVPRPERRTPLAGWKRIDFIQDDLPKRDQGRAEREGGLITIEDWMGKVIEGSPEA